MIVIAERTDQLRGDRLLIRILNNTDGTLGFSIFIPVRDRNRHTHQRPIHSVTHGRGNTLLTHINLLKKVLKQCAIFRHDQMINHTFRHRIIKLLATEILHSQI